MAQQALEQWIDLVGLPLDFFDFELSGTTVLPQPAVTTCPILSDKSPFTKDGWAREMRTVRFYCVTFQAKLQEASSPELIPGIPVEKVVGNTITGLAKLQEMDEATEVLTGLALTTYLAVAVSHKVFAEKLFTHSSFDPVLSTAAKQYPSDNISQLPATHLRLMREKAIQASKIGEAFMYPPFQRGLPFFPDNGTQVTLKLHQPLSKKSQAKITETILLVETKCAEINQGTSEEQFDVRADFNVGFAPELWRNWLELQGRPILPPIEEALELVKPKNNFLMIHRKFKYQHGWNLWFTLKGNEEEYCKAMLEVVKSQLDEIARMKVTQAEKKNYGQVLGGRFFEGIGNASDAVSLIREVVVTGVPKPKGDAGCNGGSFAFTQFFNFDKPALKDMVDPVKEIMIGRRIQSGEVLPTPDSRSHVKRARLISKVDGTNTEILRQSLPFAPAPSLLGPVEDGFFFIAFAKSIEVFFDILKSMTGWTEVHPQQAFSHDLLLTHAQGKFGGLFYVPTAVELGLTARMKADVYPKIPFWSEYVSTNPYIFYNHMEYLYRMSTDQYEPGDPPTKRILKLLGIVFSRWHSTWYHKFDVPRMPHLREFLTMQEQHILKEPIQLRKGYSYKKMLGEVLTSRNLVGQTMWSGHLSIHSEYLTNNISPDSLESVMAMNRWGKSENFDTFRMDPKELIVGTTDRLSFGSGKEVMPYLLESELGLSYDVRLTEFGNMGHIVPNHGVVLEKGVTGLLRELRQKLKGEGLSDDQKLFYRSAIHAYEGVQLYLQKYAELAIDTAAILTIGDTADETNQRDRRNLQKTAKRMLRLATKKPRSFHDAVQMIFTLHSCMHIVGQPVSVGRLDQLLIKYYQQDIERKKLAPEKAQEIIDAFFIKFDEHAVLNRSNIPYGHTTYGSTCVTGRGGPFGTGDSLNQWIQQLTVGGYKANSNEAGEDGCNEVTLLCLRAARRLPLNAPCLSLRLTPTTPQEVICEAAKALISGGAHPVLLNDDKLVAGLYNCLVESFEKSPTPFPMPDDLLAVARDYSCDGCFEPMYMGRCEFKFSYVFILQAVILTLDAGANYQGAGPLNLAGQIDSFRTALPKDIKTFKHFQEIFLIHLKRMVENTFGLILSSYGNPWKICPSPLLSCTLEGCVETGRDLTNGGSRFHILTPMYVGLTNTINSLYCVKKMVFDRNNVTTLEILRMALMNNWGENMVEPFFDLEVVGSVHTDMWAQRYKDLRDYAFQLPKFGTPTADEEVNEIAYWVAENMNTIAREVLYNSDAYKSLQQKYSVEGKPFVIQVMSGSGTFENYNSVGVGCAATPDGRLNGQPVASDCSAQPYLQDRPVPIVEPFDIIETLKPYNTPKFYGNIPNGAEVDLTIPEDFPIESLVQFINTFAQGKTGPHIATVTCVDALTMQRAKTEPQKFDLIRNRMGGWTNFFCAMFPEHQKQHERRPMYAPHKEQNDKEED